MHYLKHPLTRLFLLLFLVVPLITWFFIKPVRVIAPEFLGLSCYESGLCIDDEASYAQAKQLFEESLSFINLNIHTPDNHPRVIFCVTSSCADMFGLGKRSAVTVGTMGSVIGPHAWKSYYVRHELIHQLQGEKLGVIRYLFKPSWLIEGMAYSLSEDPRHPLTSPWENYRAKFNI